MALRPRPSWAFPMILPPFRTFASSFTAQQRRICSPSDQSCARDGRPFTLRASPRDDWLAASCWYSSGGAASAFTDLIRYQLECAGGRGAGVHRAKHAHTCTIARPGETASGGGGFSAAAAPTADWRGSCLGADRAPGPVQVVQELYHVADGLRVALEVGVDEVAAYEVVEAAEVGA